MDGLAALGVAANICQFLEYGLKLASKAKKLREIGAIDPDLDQVARRLKGVAINLTPQNLPQSAGEIGHLAAECVQVSEVLITELAQLKPKDPKSKWQSFKAVVKSEHKKDRIQELENRLERCKSQLSLHLIYLSRNEVNMNLSMLSQNGQLIRSELARLNSTTKNLCDWSLMGEEIRSTFQELVQHYNESLVKSRETTVLNLLHFRDLHERFDAIADAHEKTFQWLLDEPSGIDDTLYIPEAEEPAHRNPSLFYDFLLRDDYRRIKSTARERFITWLQKDNGLFHICGKPGAGKSTLMKYICLHPNLSRHLQMWCQNAQLGLGQFFFWRPGHATQKTLKGLLGGLIHSILDKHRDLIPTAFPELWDSLLVPPALPRALEYRDFQHGFQNLLAHASRDGLHKFALFIDGLDEFDGRYLDLIQTLKAWIQQYPDVLKICVSSREYSVFQESFLSYPKFRLHELTFMDIGNMVAARLMSNTYYTALVTQNGSTTSFHESSNILSSIINRAEGVFLWVSLVLTALEDGLMSGDDLHELKQKIEAYPTELEPLYHHLIQSIHATDRRWAFRALKMAQFFQSTSERFSETGSQNTFSSSSFTEVSQRISLLQLSFIDDIEWTHAAFENVKMQGRESKGPAERLANTYKKVYGRCKGFLEVRDSDYFPASIGKHVVFTHRSVIEFLETPDVVEMTRPYLLDFDCFDGACHTLLSCLRYLHPTVFAFRDRKLGNLVTSPTVGQMISFYLHQKIEAYIRMGIGLERSGSDNFKTFLDSMGRIFSELFEILGCTPRLLEPSQYLAVKSLSLGAFEYLHLVRDRDPGSPLLQMPPDYLVSVFHEFYRFGTTSRWLYYTQERFIEVLSCFLSLGLDLNTCEAQGRFHIEGRFLGSTPWQGFLWDLMRNRFPKSWCSGTLVDWFLRHGADPGLTVGKLAPSGPHSLPWMFPKEGWEIFRPFSEAEISFASLLKGRELPRPDTVVIMKSTASLSQTFKAHGGALTLRELVADWFPEDAVYFHDLIDSLLSSEGGQHRALEPSPARKKPMSRKTMIRVIEKDSTVCDETDLKWELSAAGMQAQDLDERLGLGGLARQEVIPDPTGLESS
ncbi:hypothetical protein HD806DRAFT_467954 [Xylariaceae sp. AK1471]|nr:hypothetical protein HD806DRAFT_467954 [Xylariaceae sp. AK1471]